MRNLTVFIVVLASISGAKVRAEGDPETCTYKTYKWNVHLRQAVEVETICHPYNDLKSDEISAGPTIRARM